MNWTIITLPAPEELACGYTATGHSYGDNRQLRHILISLFAVFGLLVGIQTLALENDQPGQRRIAETHLSERKLECRDCPHRARSLSNLARAFLRIP